MTILPSRTMLRPVHLTEVWTSGDVPRLADRAQLCADPPMIVLAAGGTVPLDQFGVRLWLLVDGARSAPTLAQVLAEEHGRSALDMAVDVHARLEALAAVGAISWV